MARLMIPGGGDLDQRVQLYDLPTEGQDEYGQPTSTSALLGEFWCSIRLIGMRERAAAGQELVMGTHRVTMRWLGSMIPATTGNPSRRVLPGMHLIAVIDGSRLDILEADNVRKAGVCWVITCQERTVI
jgi:head-tail adaptor